MSLIAYSEFWRVIKHRDHYAIFLLHFWTVTSSYVVVIFAWKKAATLFRLLLPIVPRYRSPRSTDLSPTTISVTLARTWNDLARFTMRVENKKGSKIVTQPLTTSTRCTKEMAHSSLWPTFSNPLSNTWHQPACTIPLYRKCKSSLSRMIDNLDQPVPKLFAWNQETN